MSSTCSLQCRCGEFRRVLLVNMFPAFWSPQERFGTKSADPTRCSNCEYHAYPCKTSMSWGSSSRLVLRRKIPRRVIRASFFSWWFRASYLRRSGKEAKISSPLTCMVRNLKALNCSFLLYTSALRHYDRRMSAKLAYLLVCIPEHLAYLSIKKHLT